MPRIPINIADLVGRTPMVELARLAPEGAQVFAKLEMFNPGGSVKDRIGVAMIEAAEAEGRIEPGRTTIVEATSGNTGIALAFVCAARGYDLVLTLPQGMSREREGLLRLYGAQVQVTESLGGMNEAVAAAQALARDADVWLPDQFSNPANPEAHRRTTGPEIWEALDGKVDYLVAGVGTGGTITGAGGYLKERNPKLKVIGVEPASSAVISGGEPGPHKIQGIGAGFVPPVLDRELLDEMIAVDDEDAIETARLVARREGVLAGISCGAALWAALQIAAREEARGARIVVVMPDSGERYVSTPFFAPEAAAQLRLVDPLQQLAHRREQLARRLTGAAVVERPPQLPQLGGRHGRVAALDDRAVHLGQQLAQPPERLLGQRHVGERLPARRGVAPRDRGAGERRLLEQRRGLVEEVGVQAAQVPAVVPDRLDALVGREQRARQPAARGEHVRPGLGRRSRSSSAPTCARPAGRRSPTSRRGARRRRPGRRAPRRAADRPAARRGRARSRTAGACRSPRAPARRRASSARRSAAQARGRRRGRRRPSIA